MMDVSSLYPEGMTIQGAFNKYMRWVESRPYIWVKFRVWLCYKNIKKCPYCG